MTWLENGLEIGLFLKNLRQKARYPYPLCWDPILEALSLILRPFSSCVISFPVVSLFWNQRVVREFLGPLCEDRRSIPINFDMSWSSIKRPRRKMDKVPCSTRSFYSCPYRTRLRVLHAEIHVIRVLHGGQMNMVIFCCFIFGGMKLVSSRKN